MTVSIRRGQDLNPGTRSSIERALNRRTSLESYAVADVPPATTPGQLIFVSNETGGATVAFSDGTNWRRVQDRVIVS